MSIEVRRFTDATVMPWANGGGTTRELLRIGPPGATNSFHWRVSVADVEGDGNFSRLPGIDRTLILCTGALMILTIDGVRHEVARWQPFAFDGGARVSCRIPAGPTQDLNVMAAHGVVDAEVAVFADWDDAIPITGAADYTLLVALADSIAVRTVGESQPIALDRFDSVRLRRHESALITGSGAVARIVATYRRPMPVT